MLAGARGISNDELFITRPRGPPTMGRRRGGERSTERTSPALAADFADDSSDEETAGPPARRSGGCAGEDAAGALASSSEWAAGASAEGIAREIDDASPVRAPRDGGVGGTPGGSASRRRMDSASKHDALEARDVSGPDVPEIPTLSDSRAFADGTYADGTYADGTYADDATATPECAAGTETNVRSVRELNRATTFAGGGPRRARFRRRRTDVRDERRRKRRGARRRRCLSASLGSGPARVLGRGRRRGVGPRAAVERGEARLETRARGGGARQSESRLGAGASERDGFGFGGDDFFEGDAVGGALGAVDFASPAETGAAADAKKGEGLLGHVREKSGKTVGARDDRESQTQPSRLRSSTICRAPRTRRVFSLKRFFTFTRASTRLVS